MLNKLISHISLRQLLIRTLLFGIAVMFPRLIHLFESSSTAEQNGSVRVEELIVKHLVDHTTKGKWLVYVGNDDCNKCYHQIRRLDLLSQKLVSCSGITPIALFIVKNSGLDVVESRMRDVTMTVVIESCDTRVSRGLFLVSDGRIVHTFHTRDPIDFIKLLWGSC